MSKNEHECRESRSCSCMLQDLEPRDDCPMHGLGPWPPRCEECGRFLSREVREKTLKELNKVWRAM